MARIFCTLPAATRVYLIRFATCKAQTARTLENQGLQATVRTYKTQKFDASLFSSL